MDCTFIKYVDGKKEVRYGIDPVLNSKDVETYLYLPVSDEGVEEIKKCVTEKVQEVLSKFF